MKNATPGGNRVVALSTSDSVDGNRIVSDRTAPTQHELLRQLTESGIPIASFWKGPRNRREAIQVSLKSYEGHAYLDARVHSMDASGRMVPTPRGVAVGVKTLPLFAKAIGDGLRKAALLGLTVAST
jgi:hypothetical protein